MKIIRYMAVALLLGASGLAVAAAASAQTASGREMNNTFDYYLSRLDFDRAESFVKNAEDNGLYPEFTPFWKKRLADKKRSAGPIGHTGIPGARMPLGPIGHPGIPGAPQSTSSSSRQ